MENGTLQKIYKGAGYASAGLFSVGGVSAITALLTSIMALQNSRNSSGDLYEDASRYALFTTMGFIVAGTVAGIPYIVGENAFYSRTHGIPPVKPDQEGPSP